MAAVDDPTGVKLFGTGGKTAPFLCVCVCVLY